MLQNIVTAVTLLGIFCYVLGLVTVNLHLARIGFSDFSLLRAQYIATGVLVLLYIGSCGFFVFLGAWWLSQDFNDVLTVIGLLLIGLIPGFLFFAQYFSAKWSDLRRSPTSIRESLEGKSLRSIIIMTVRWYVEIYQEVNRELGRFYLALITAACTGASVFLLWVIARLEPIDAAQAPIFAQDLIRRYIEPWDSNLRNVERWFWFAFIGLILLFSISAFFMLFLRTIFPNIRASYGGGRPKNARLLFKDESIKATKHLNIPMSSSDSPLSEIVSVVFEGASTYALRLPDDRLVQVDKAMVEGVEIVN